MAAAASRLSAKFSLPLLNETVYPRERLFTLLRGAFERRATVWADGPAGAGKTTLAASFQAQEDLATIWYRLDIGDSEPGVFFAEMAHLLVSRDRSPPDLPLYDGRLPVDPRRFAHRFFRAFFDLLPPNLLLVFDDYQEIDATSPLHEIFAILLSQAAAGQHILLLSRDAPPAPLADLLPSGRLVRFGWDVLRLDTQETDRLADLLLPAGSGPPPELERLKRRVHGWPAGLVLLFQQAAGDGATPDLPASSTPETVSAFFAAELERRIGREELHHFCRLALFPSFTAEMARELVPECDCAALVDRLARQNFFIGRHQEKTPVYRFHPLLHESLGHLLAGELSPAQLQTLHYQAARILEAHASGEEALELYLRAGAWQEAEALFMKIVPRLGMAGAYRSLEAWLDRFPEECFAATPWLLYWRGLCRWTRNPPLGRADLELAYHRFAQQGEGLGRLYAWCSLLEALVLEWGDLHPIDEWIGRRQELAEVIATAPQELQDRAALTLFTAYVYRRPQASEMPDLLEAAHALFVRSQDLLLKVLAGNHLTFYSAFMRGNLSQAKVYAEGIDAFSDGAEPIAKVVSHANRSLMAFWLQGDTTRAKQWVREGLRFAEEAGVHFWDFMLNAIGAWVSISALDYDQAESYLEELGRGLQHEALINRCVFHDTQAILGLHRGQLDMADHHSRLSLELARQGGMPYAEAACLVTCSRVKTLQQDYAQAGRLRDEAQRIADSMHNAFIGYHLLMFEAAELCQRHGPEAPRTRASLARALQAAVAGRFYGNLWLDRRTLLTFCRLGLLWNQEPDYLREIIFRYGLQPASPRWALDGWPFALKVSVLSGLAVERLTERGYEPLQLIGRVAQLLEALVWYGGKRVDQTSLTDILWPDAEGDAGRRSFDTTLHRLRRQFADDRLLVLEDGRLSLHEALCAHDIATLRDALEEVGNVLADNPEPPALLAAQGTLLQQVAGFRPEGLSSLFSAQGSLLIRQVRPILEHLAAYWLRTGDSAPAVEPLEEVLRLDPLAESAYELLMQARLQQDKPGEALAVYARCAAALENQLGVRPGEPLAQLRRQARTAREDTEKNPPRAPVRPL